MASVFVRDAYDKEAQKHAAEGRKIILKSKKLTQLMFPENNNTPISPEKFRDLVKKN